MITVKSPPRRVLARNLLMRAAVPALAIILLLVGLPVAGVDAHAGYESSTPADSEVVPEGPEQVDVFFSQEMARSGGLPSLIVVNASGDQVDLGSELDDADRTHMFAPLAPALPNGRYTVIWNTLSDEDGEEAQGAFHFIISTATGETTPSPQPTLPDKGTPAPTSTAAPTEPPAADSEDDSDGVPAWVVIVGLLATAVVAGGAGLVIGRRSSG